MSKSKTLSEAQIDRLLREVDERNFLQSEEEFFGVRRFNIDGLEDGEFVAVETLRAVQCLGASL